MEIHEIFPIAVGTEYLKRELTKDERDFIYSLRSDNQVNGPEGSNFISNKYYVLDEEPLKSLKSELEAYVNEYFQLVKRPAEGQGQLYITTSWITWTEKDQGHHPHDHPNSYISGTFYVDSCPSDMITFIRDEKNDEVYVHSLHINQFGTKTWNMPASKGSIKLFSSRLKHEVLPRTEDGNRCCLAFNTWFKGTIGYQADTIKFMETEK